MITQVIIGMNPRASPRIRKAAALVAIVRFMRNGEMVNINFSSILKYKTAGPLHHSKSEKKVK